MDEEYPESPESRLPRLTPDDEEQARKAFTDWARRYLYGPGADLSAMPAKAFMAGYAFASQWWRD